MLFFARWSLYHRIIHLRLAVGAFQRRSSLFTIEGGVHVVKRLVFCGLVIVLALPAARGRDDPGQEKKPPSVKEQYDELVKALADERQKLQSELRKAKGDDAAKAMEKFRGLSKEYAERFFKLAEDNPSDPASNDALFWILQNAVSHAKAEKKLVGVVAEMPLTELQSKLGTIRGRCPAAILEAVANRAEKDEKDKLAGDLLGWVASKRTFAQAAQGNEMQIVEGATARLIEKYPDHPAIEQMCQVLARGRSPKDVETLKTIIEKARSNRVKAEASLGLGQSLSAQLDSFGGSAEQAEKLAAEADKYLTEAVELLAKEKLDAKKQAAEQELKAFRTLRVGKEAPEISGKDLDGTEFKLSDYRGKVILLDFWGNW
jgi:AhpC/TSA family